VSPIAGARYLIAIVGIVALAAIAATALVVVERQGGSPPSQIEDANQINACMRTHHMATPAEWIPDYTASTPKFVQLNPYGDNETASDDQPMTSAEESCQWPPSGGADATGFSLVLLTPVVATRGRSFYAYPNSYADIVDSTCSSVAVTYERIHMGYHWTLRVDVGRGQLADDEGPTFGRIQVSNGADTKYVGTLTQWATFLGYFVSPTESAVVYDEADSLVAASCTS
jgi:hypothetical protein